MRRIFHRHIGLFLVLISCCVTAQKNRKEVQIVTDSVPDDVVFNVYEFKGINSYPEYFNKQKLKEIITLDQEEKWDELYTALKSYVSRFGIRNFYKDTKLIWRLAKMTELFGDKEEAMTLYRMVLRHHYQGINIKEIELYYDSLNRQAAEQFVPIDYYYELVEHRKLIDTLQPPRGVLLNMGMLVNSSSADYGPSLNIHNDILVFTSKRKKVDETIRFREDEDLYFSRRDPYGTWSNAKPIQKLNSHNNEGSPCLSGNG